MATTDIRSLQDRSKLPVKDAGGSTVGEFFEANRAAIAAVLPRHMTPDRLMKTALGAIRTTPQLQECTTASLFGALVQSASLGLECNTPLGHAYLVPFWNNKQNRRDVQLIIGYRGYIDLASRSGKVVNIMAHAVRERDEFSIDLGTESRIIHRPNMREDRGEILAFYAVANLQGGGTTFEAMSISDVLRIANNAHKKGLPAIWRDNLEEMGRKTPVRRLAKYLPLSIELATAIALDEMAESGQSQGMERVIEGSFSVAAGIDEDGGNEEEQTIQPEPAKEQVHVRPEDRVAEDPVPRRGAKPGMNLE